jgi:hypothetical protein
MGSELKLGTILTEPMGRDALHVAIVDVIATEMLHPGEHIEFIAEGNCTDVRAAKDIGIGIVDPFLLSPARKGERIWMFLLPNTITSLRHEWTHPAFVPPPVSPHVEWMTEYAEGYQMTYDEIMEAAKSWVEDGDHLNHGSKFEGEYVPDEFWTHYEAITGTKGEGSFFTCSC